MTRNQIITAVGTLTALAGLGFLILTGEPTAKKYAADNSSAYPKMQAQPPLVGTSLAAKIDGKEILEDELIGPDLMTYYGIKQKEYEFKMARLRRYLTQHFIELKSKELNISPEDYVRNHVVKDQKIEPTDSEIAQFASEQGLPPLDQIKANEQGLAQVTQFLRMKKEFDLVQVEVNRWTKTHKVEYFFPRPSIPIEIPTIGSPSWGGDKAKVVMIEFGDFECPFCARAAVTVLKLKQKYGDKLKIVYKHLPIPTHVNAVPAAIASVCVHQQKPNAFWKYYEIILNNQKKISESYIQEVVKGLKLNLEKFNVCVRDPKSSLPVQQDTALADKLGLESTPVFFINGEVISGAAPIEAFEEIIDYHLEH